MATASDTTGTNGTHVVDKVPPEVRESIFRTIGTRLAQDAFPASMKEHDDPHFAWAVVRESILTVIYFVPERDDDEKIRDPLYAAVDLLTNAIAETRAKTPAGVAEQVRLVSAQTESDGWQAKGIANALSTLERQARDARA